MTGVVAGIGVRAILGGFASKAASAAVRGGKAFTGWFGRRTALEAVLLVALAVLLVFGVRQHFALAHAHHDTAAAQADAAKAQKDARDAKVALKTSQANETLLRGQIADTNQRITALAKQSADLQQAAAEARQKNAGRVAAAEATSQRAAASARQQPAAGAPCEPSDTLKDAWR